MYINMPLCKKFDQISRANNVIFLYQKRELNIENILYIKVFNNIYFK